MTSAATSSSKATPSADAARPDAALRLQRAATLIAAQRWDEAAHVLEMIDPPAQVAMTRRLARNMAAMLAVRPKVYQRLFECLLSGDAGPYRMFTSARGNPGLARVGPDARATPLCAGSDPVEALRQALDRQIENLKTDRVAALLSLGDGYLLRHLAEHPPKLGHPQMKPLVSIIEPDLRLVLGVMRLHDLAGEDGPIRQTRFRWYVGPTWEQQLESDIEADPYLPPPQFGLTQHGAPELVQKLETIAQRVMDRVDALRQSVHAEYAKRSAAAYAELLGENPPRPPRVLLLTSRFTTVLQYSTADFAHALEQLGWQTMTVIEPTDGHRCWSGGLVRQLAEFRPDLIFSIDHLRHEQRVLPDGIPHLCWVQDDLPNLMDAAAAENIGPRDFVIMPTPEVYCHDFGYPRRQCAGMPKVTRLPDRPASWQSDGDDLVFVSHASATVDRLFEQLQAMVPAGTVERRIAEGTVRRMLAVYESGASLYAFSDVQRLLELEARELGGGFPQDQARRWSIILFNTVNNPLYRQQALRWVVDAARDMGLTLALYGQGWEDHPDFASHARGPVQYGPELEHLTRRAKINLQIIPYSCFHQRLIDGIAAGGFYLIRHNIFDTMLNDARHFLEQRLEDRDQDLAALRQRLDGPGRAQLADIQNRWEQMMQLPGATMLEAYRSRRDHGFLETLGGFPHAEEVSFRSPEQLRSLLERFAFDADARKEHWGRQYRYVQQRLTYLAMFKSVRRWMSDRLGEEVAT